jgi:cation diffusion facilitator CzcD-associated flavoprotein CzcO
MYLSTPQSTIYDEERELWESIVACPDGERQVSARYLVLAHGGGYSGRFVPDIPGGDLFTGSIQHSVDFQNAEALVKNGAKV